MPECKADGGYHPVQCDAISGHCWCVDVYGYEVKGSRIKGRPSCGKEVHVTLTSIVITLIALEDQSSFDNTNVLNASLVHYQIQLCLNGFSIMFIVLQKERNPRARRHVTRFLRPSPSPLRGCLFRSAARTVVTKLLNAMAPLDSVGVLMSMVTS